MNLAGVRQRKTRTEVFVDWEQLMPVLSVLVPTAVYVVRGALVGIYVASARATSPSS